MINIINSSNKGVRFDFLSMLKFSDPTLKLNNTINFYNYSKPTYSNSSQVLLSKGKLKVKVKQGLSHKMIIKFSMDAFKKNGQKLRDSIVYQPGVNYLDIDLTGYIFNDVSNLLNFTIDELI